MRQASDQQTRVEADGTQHVADEPFAFFGILDA
jgi:hypothetical protein